MKNMFKYFSVIVILVLVLSGCNFIKNVEENPIDPNYESGLSQQELFSYLNKPIGYREDKVDNYIYFTFYLDHKVEYSFSNEEIIYKGNVIDFTYLGKNHFEISCQFDPEDDQNFASFVKTFDICFEEKNPDRIEISFDGNTYSLIDDIGFDYGGLMLSLQLYRAYFVEFTDAVLYVSFYDGNQFYYDNGSKVLTGTVDNIIYLGKDVYDVSIKISDGENQYHNPFLLTYSSSYPEKIFIELEEFGLVEMQADKGRDTVDILTILNNDGPFKEVNGKNIRIFDVDNFYYIKTNINEDYLLKGIITLFDYCGRGIYSMTVQFSIDDDLENIENKYDIEVTFEYDEQEKILKIKEYDILRMIKENYIFKPK
ncbi:MAG: hypothetical protein QM204_01265 [Bacillota bacterium]|jgi:hypothetical protein|nr:hypothetical protein [Bacillota bacterium]NLL26659.1 hypothetical protein [Erysipelotrichia bacterium]